MSRPSGDSVFGILRNLVHAPESNPFSEFIGTFMARDALELAERSMTLPVYPELDRRAAERAPDILARGRRR